MSKKQENIGLSFNDKKIVMKYFVPIAIVVLLFVALGDLMQKELTYPKLKQETGKLVKVEISKSGSINISNRKNARHIDLWIEVNKEILKYYVSVRHQVDADNLKSKLIVGDSLNFYIYKSTQRLLKPNSRHLILAIQHNNEDILSLAELKDKTKYSLYISIVCMAILLALYLYYWRIYIPNYKQNRN